jgi:RNA polymerase sigma factor (sigma-70 family)
MSDLSLDDLIASAQADPADDSGAMNEIVRRFDGLARRIGSGISSRADVEDDATQEARIGLMVAIRKHRVGTPGFPAYARKYMRFAALRFVTASASSEVSVDPRDEFWLGPDLAPSTPSTDGEVYDLLTVLTAEQRRVAVARYVANDTVTEIARSLNVSVPAVSQRLNTIHRALRPMITAAVAA